MSRCIYCGHPVNSPRTFAVCKGCHRRVNRALIDPEQHRIGRACKATVEDQRADEARTDWANGGVGR